MFILGLTGPTGSGKSLAASRLKELGFEVLDADRVARSVVEPGTACLRELEQAFGSEIIRDDGSLNRKALASVVFSDQNELKKLNSITHPHIIIEMQKQLEGLEAEGCKYAVLDAPALFEAGAERLCDRVMVITAPRALRLERILHRDGITPEEAVSRIDAQPDERFYTSRADYSVSSEMGTRSLMEQIDEIAAEIMRLSAD